MMHLPLLIGVIMGAFQAQAGAPFSVTSPDIQHGQPIDQKYTCEGEEKAPVIKWHNVPKGTRSLALVLEDPDAPHPDRPNPEPWIHWIVYNIPVDRASIGPSLGRQKEVEDGTLQGKNCLDNKNCSGKKTGSGKIGYDGPCPPAGPAHRYFFKLYALDTMFDLKGGATKQDLLEAMQGHIIAQTELIGTYQSIKSAK
jgi:Raf kinase inhibitor-like YbhB/YbcL family protein